MSALDWAAAGYISQLATTYRVLSIDPLGYGASDKPSNPSHYYLSAVSQDLTAVLDAAGERQAVLWGYSRGSWLACIAAINFPERVSGLVLGGADLLSRLEAAPVWLEPLKHGRWEEFWTLYPSVSPEFKQRAQVRNDPRVIAATFSGARLEQNQLKLSALVAPRYIYCGDKDNLEGHVATATALGVSLNLIEGHDHLDAFEDVKAVITPVMQFLDEILNP